MTRGSVVVKAVMTAYSEVQAAVSLKRSACAANQMTLRAALPGHIFLQRLSTDLSCPLAFALQPQHIKRTSSKGGRRQLAEIHLALMNHS